MSPRLYMLSARPRIYKIPVLSHSGTFFLSPWSWGLCGTFYIKFIAESNLEAPTFQGLVSLPVNCFGNKHKLQILDMAISGEKEV